MKAIHFVTISIIASFCLGCEKGDDDYLYQSNNLYTKNYSRSLEEAISETERFIGDMSIRTRGYTQSTSVRSVVVWRKHDLFPQTRGSDTINDIPDTLLYGFDFQDRDGFALVAADKRIGDIVALVEKGSLRNIGNTGNQGMDLFWQGLKNYLGGHPHFPINDSLLYHPEIELYNIDTLYTPLLATKWGQYYPYNLYCPEIAGQRAPTGCIATAIAQICGFYKWPSSFNQHDYDWDSITEDSIPIITTTQLELARFMHDFGVYIGMNYTDTLSTAHSSDLYMKFDSLGYESSPFSEYNVDSCINNIANNHPVYIVGYKEETTSIGHAWVLDGAIIRSIHYINLHQGYPIVVRLNIQKLFHCNWGLDGDYNGYFLSNAFDTDNMIYNSNKTRSSYNSKNRVYYNLIPKQ